MSVCFTPRPLRAWPARAGLAVAASAVALACGGSSSETPPPLEPHPMNLHYSRAATTLGTDELHVPGAEGGERADPNQPRDVPEDEVDEVTPAAPPTWGSGRPKAR
jgi:hypothetical protein